MTEVELFLLLEYMTHKHELLSNDLQAVRTRFDYYNADSQNVYDLIVVSTRLDTASSIFRELRQLLLIK